MKSWLLLAATIVAALLLGLVAAQPPAPLGAAAPAAEFAAGRAMADVRAIARAPHPTGSPENAAVRAHLVARLEALGFEVRTADVPLSPKPAERLRKWGGDPKSLATNIIALRPGRDRAAPAVLLMAHYDSVWASPGAADDAAGVAAALEIARAIPAGAQARDLVILLTDAEELGLVGARGFFADAPAGDPLADRIGAIVNMETRGGGGRAFMFETGPGNGAMMRLYAGAVRDPSTTSMAVKLYEMLPNSTDLTAAKHRGIAGFNFAFTGGAELYHSPLATPDALDQGALQHLGSQGLDVTRALLAARELPAKAPDVVFGDGLGLFTFAYPALLGWGLIAVVAGLIVLAARRVDWRWPGVLGGLVDGLVAAAAAAVLLYGGNLLSGADGPTNYYDRLAALSRLEVQALLLVAAGLALALAMQPRRRGRWEGWLGLAGLCLTMAVAVQAVLPAGGAIFTLPVLAAAVTMVVASRAPAAGMVLAVVVAVAGLAWLGGLAHGVLLGIGAGMPGVAAVFVPMAALLLWPLLPVLGPRRPAALVALVLLLGGAGLALWVRLDPVAPTVPPYSDKT